MSGGRDRERARSDSFISAFRDFSTRSNPQDLLFLASKSSADHAFVSSFASCSNSTASRGRRTGLARPGAAVPVCVSRRLLRRPLLPLSVLAATGNS